MEQAFIAGSKYNDHPTTTTNQDNLPRRVPVCRGASHLELRLEFDGHDNQNKIQFAGENDRSK
jgi:hypothetical protein